MGRGRFCRQFEPTKLRHLLLNVRSATRDFRANRIGFCVLHPLSVAGNPVSLRSPDGMSAGVFPRAVSPHQPFLELTGMSYAVGAASVDIRFEGGTFETEDQRNWTDASFKTYSPPLRAPFPRTYKKGEEVRQQVVVEVMGPSTGTQRSRERERIVHAHLGGIVPAKLPAIGVGGGGLEAANERAEIQEALEQLRPSHLHAVVEPQRMGWETRLRAAVGVASQTGTPLQCEVVVAEPDQLELVAEVLAADNRSLSRLMLFDTTSSVTTRTIVSRWGRLAEKYDLPASVFGGSRANFAELNRNEPPYELISGLTFAINPQVHAFGDDEIVETLTVQEVVARQAVAMAPSLPLHVGPVTLKSRFNAVATDKTDLEEPQPDTRQSSWWAAGWTLGSLAALARGGATSVTYFDLAGPHALLGRSASSVSQASSAPYPVFQIIRRVAAIRGAHLLATHVSDQKAVAMLALAKGNHLVVFAANLVDEKRVVRFEGQSLDFVTESLVISGAGLARGRHVIG